MFCNICHDRIVGIDGYSFHLKRFHPRAAKTTVRHFSGGSMQQIRPIRTTIRTKLQIVHDIEKTWGAALIPEIKPWHSLEESNKKGALI